MPLLWLSLAFLAGLVLATGVALPWTAWGGAAALCAAAAVFEKRAFGGQNGYLKIRKWLKIPLALLMAALLLGGMRQELAHQPPTPADLAFYNDPGGTTTRVQGVLSAEPEAAAHVTLELEARSITPLAGSNAGETIPVSGGWRSTPLAVSHNAGDPVLSALYSLRQQARDTINAVLPAPEAGLLNGILLGIQDDLPQAEIQAFQATGTAHIWAISG